jgi:hypothetical protein
MITIYGETQPLKLLKSKIKYIQNINDYMKIIDIKNKYIESQKKQLIQNIGNKKEFHLEKYNNLKNNCKIEKNILYKFILYCIYNIY